MDRDDIIKYHQNYMEIVFRMEGRFVPLGVLYATRAPDGSILAEPMPCLISDAPDSQALADGMKQIAASVGAVGSLVLAEIWMADVPPADAERVLREGAAKQPDRREYLLIVADIDGERTLHAAAIKRDARGRGAIEPWQKLSAAVEGRFADLLPKLN